MPSEAILNKKKEAVKTLTEKLKSSHVGVLVNFKGINVENDTQMRKEFREANVDYFVVKNSILRFACKEVGLDLDEFLNGTTAIALSKDDPVSGPKIIYKHIKNAAGKTEFGVKAGFMDNEILDEAKVKELGTLPSCEQLVGQLLSLLVSPMRSLAIAVSEVAKKVESEGVDKPQDLSANTAEEEPQREQSETSKDDSDSKKTEEESKEAEQTDVTPTKQTKKTESSKDEDK